MLASNNPITFIPVLKTTRFFINAQVNDPFARLTNSLIILNPETGVIDINFSVSRVFATFAASTLSGTVTVTQGSDTVIGDENTDFLNEVVVGDIITVTTLVTPATFTTPAVFIDEQLEVKAIVSKTQITLVKVFTGTTVAGIILTKSPRPTQKILLLVTINGINVSSKIIGQVSVDWPDDGGGTAKLSLAESNPFSSGAVVNIDRLVDIIAGFTDLNNQFFQVRLFKGRVVQFDYDPDGDILSVDVQDLSRDISKETDKINQEIHGVDPVFVEVRTAGPNTLTTTRRIDPFTENPIFGIWDEVDFQKRINLAERVDFLISEDDKTITFISPLDVIIGGRNYSIRYALAVEEFVRPTTRKSGIVQQIAQLAGVTSLINERAGKIEDEIVTVNIIANQEFPLDILRKVVLPQTWKLEYTENGDLLIRRDKLKAIPDFIFNQSSIIENTLKLTKALDKVINEQSISGIVKRLGREDSTVG